MRALLLASMLATGVPALPGATPAVSPVARAHRPVAAFVVVRPGETVAWLRFGYGQPARPMVARGGLRVVAPPLLTA